jgi:5-carboxymethyl-2-hydroxymuconate isomerase
LKGAREEPQRCSNGRFEDSRKQSCPGIRETTKRILRNTVDQEIQNRKIELSTGLREVNNSTIWKVALPKRRKTSSLA